MLRNIFSGGNVAAACMCFPTIFEEECTPRSHIAVSRLLESSGDIVGTVTCSGYCTTVGMGVVLALGRDVALDEEEVPFPPAIENPWGFQFSSGRLSYRCRPGLPCTSRGGGGVQC